MKQFLLGPAVAALGILGLASCGASTQFTDIWKAPDAGQVQAQKILAVFISADESLRRVGEDALVSSIQNPATVPSYSVLTEDEIKDVDAAKAKINQMGFDHAVMMRVVGTDEQSTYVPGRYVSDPYPPAYRSYWGYYSYAWPVVYEPGYTITNKYVMVETSIYSLTEDKLLWMGHSKTVDPSSVTSLVQDVAREARKILVKQGLAAEK